MNRITRRGLIGGAVAAFIVPARAAQIASRVRCGDSGRLPSRRIYSTNPNCFAVPFGLIGYWGLDPDCLDFAGNKALDLSGNNNTGTLNNITAAQLATGQIGTGIAGDGNAGNNRSITGITVGPSGAASRTISAWCKLVGVNDAATVIGYGSGASGPEIFDLTASVANNGKWSIRFDTAFDLSSALSSSSDIGSWVMMTATYDGTIARLYRNAAQIASLTHALNTVNGNLRLGAPSDRSDLGYLNGIYDDCRLYNRALDPWEIVSLYNAGLNGQRAIVGG